MNFKKAFQLPNGNTDYTSMIMTMTGICSFFTAFIVTEALLAPFMMLGVTLIIITKMMVTRKYST